MSARRRLRLSCATIALAAVTACAHAGARLPAQPGFWQTPRPHHALTPEAADALLTSLHRITGLQTLAFDAAGRLTIASDRVAEGGSPRAAGILLEAFGSGDMFVIEEHSGSTNVTFGQIEPMDYADGAAPRRRVWWIRLDFEDFRTISGPVRVRQAFDPGFVLLHEVLHARGFHDAADDGLGECETILNEVRAELGLPRRASYAAQWTNEQGHGQAQARLLFRDDRPGGRTRLRSLRFAPGPVEWLMRSDVAPPAGRP